MPFNHKIHKEGEIVIVKAIGVIDINSTLEAIASVIKDPEFSPHFQIIVDLRKIQYNPSILDIFKIKDSLNSKMKMLQGTITLVTTPAFSHLTKLVCIMTSVYNIKMYAVTESSLLDEYDAVDTSVLRE